MMQNEVENSRDWEASKKKKIIIIIISKLKLKLNKFGRVWWLGLLFSRYICMNNVNFR